MDLLTLLTALAGILGFLYLLIIGQKSIPEWLAEQKSKKKHIEQPALRKQLDKTTSRTLHNLPHRSDFVGREHEKKQVHNALQSRSHLIMIDGIGGIGKTSLALEVLHECLNARQGDTSGGTNPLLFEAIIWASARDHAISLNDVLDIAARTLEYPKISELSSADKRHEILKHFQKNPCLLVIDNFETITDQALIEFIQSIPEPSKCLITSRVQNIRQARSISLHGMQADEASILVQNEGKRVGIDLTALISNGEKFQQFYEATGGAPLALRWSIGQIKQRGQSIDSVLNSLHDAEGNIFEAIFERAWLLLSRTSKAVLTILPVFASSASKDAIAMVCDLSGEEIREGLGQLVEMWLVEVSQDIDEINRRYRLHPLTRSFAGRHLSAKPDLEHRTKLKLAEFFANFSSDRGGNRWSWQQYDEIEAEILNIFPLIEWCFNNGVPQAGIKLTKSITFFMSVRGYVSEALYFGRKAAHAARNNGRPEDLAWLLIKGVGWREINGGDPIAGEAFCREGLRIYEELEDPEGIQNAWFNLGRALLLKEDFDGAMACYEKSRQYLHLKHDRQSEALFQRELALLAILESRYKDAQNILELLTPQLRENDELLFVNAIEHLVHVYYKQKNYESAYRSGIEGLNFARKQKRREITAKLCRTLAITEFERGNYPSAYRYAKEALQYYEKSGMYSNTIEKLKALISEIEKKS